MVWMTSIFESVFQFSVGVLCAVTAAILPASLAGLAGYLFFLLPVGMTIIGSRRGDARKKMQAAIAQYQSAD